MELRMICSGEERERRNEVKKVRISDIGGVGTMKNEENKSMILSVVPRSIDGRHTYQCAYLLIALCMTTLCNE